jgi:tRNA (cmo5U34)-methyltransferase
MRENSIGYRKRIDTIKGDFSKRSVIYDDYIVKVVPYHSEMLKALVDNIPFSTDKPIRIIELGCGTGIATYTIIKKYPDAHLKCIDMSSDMLNLVQKKLEGFPNIEFIQADYTKYKFEEEYDAVVSFLSFMYLADDKTRRSLFQKAFDMLTKGGVFMSGESNISRSKHFQEVCMERWIHHMRKSYSDDFIKKEVLEKAKKHGKASVLTDEIKYLEEIGFSQVDIFWKYYGFSVYGAIK